MNIDFCCSIAICPMKTVLLFEKKNDIISQQRDNNQIVRLEIITYLHNKGGVNVFFFCRNCSSDGNACTCKNSLHLAVQLISSAFLENRKLLLCGNGGSCSDCDHIAAEFIKTNIMSSCDSFVGFKAISLCSNSSVLTAISNDLDYNRVYAQQVCSLGDPKDVLLAISTSGKSKNILFALMAARQKGMYTILLTGPTVSTSKAADCVINVCGDCTEEIQENHIVVYHQLCRKVIEICTK